MTHTVSQEIISLVKHYEGFHRRLSNGLIGSYLCPAQVWSIGYGSTTLKGKPVTASTTCTQAEAEIQFSEDIEEAAIFVDRLITVKLNSGQFSALVSFVQNIGSTAFANSTIRRRLNNGEDPATVAKQELPRWIHGEKNQKLQGLVDRRQAELDCFLREASAPIEDQPKAFRLANAAKFDRGLSWQRSGWEYLFEHAPAESWDAFQEKLPAKVSEGFALRFRGESEPAAKEAEAKPSENVPNPLIGIPKFTQRDSKWFEQRDRSCYSSSNAMLVEYLKPGTLKGVNGDDLYLNKLQNLGGETTDWSSQQKTLASFGISARLVQTANWELIEQQVKRGVPVPLGYLHRGPVNSPQGSGHWCLCYGISATHIWISDPWGEPDLATGSTLTQGNWQGKVSKQNFGKRWMVQSTASGYRFAAGHGWAIVVDKK